MDLDALIQKVRKSRDFVVRAAPAAAEAMGEALRATAAAGTTPDGVAWAPRKRDGGRALAGAADAIRVKAYGSVLRATLDPIHAIHNNNPYGRKILPSTMTDEVAAAIKQSLIESWEAE